MRWALVVDTCGAEGVVAVADVAAARVVSERRLPGRATQERLMPALAEVVQESGLAGAAALDLLMVATGPGSFTGVRIGLAAVKGLAEALGVPVVAVSRLAMLAELAGEGFTGSVWLDAGRGDVFAGEFAAGESLRERMLPASAAMEAAALGGPLVVAEPALRERFASAQLLRMPGAAEALAVGLRQWQRGVLADLALLDAHYLRVPDAQLALEARQAAERQPA